MGRLTLTEAPGSLGAVQQGAGTGRRFKTLLIRAGWGSSGYYSEALLKRDGASTWPSGTQMYLDHPTVTESAERPVRSVRDLASVTTSDPVWDNALGGLVADVEVYPQWQDLLNPEFAESVGLSIRAYGEAEHGTADGREGVLITELTEGISVDWVTQAGAGGRVLELIESARTSVAEAVSTKPWSDFSASDYSLAQWRKACLISPDTTSDTKDDYKLPVREPDGTINRNGVFAAAGALAGSRSGVQASDAQKKAAASKLISLYSQVKADPPDSLLTLAGKAKPKESALIRKARGQKLTEAAKATIGSRLEAGLHNTFSDHADSMYGNGQISRPERISLSEGVGKALDSFAGHVQDKQPQLYERGVWDGPDGTQGTVAESLRRALAEAGTALTANDLSGALRDRVVDTYGGGGVYAWISDTTPDAVVFRLDDMCGGTGLYQQDYTVAEGGDVTLTGEPVEVNSRTTYVPVATDPDVPTPNTADPMTESDQPGTGPDHTERQGSTMPELTEEQATQLAESAQTRTELTETRTTLTEALDQLATMRQRLEESDAHSLRLETDRQARTACAEALATSGLPQLTHTRVIESVCRSLPTGEDGTLDTAALAESITTAIDGERGYIAQLAEATGVGLPRGLGGAPAELSDADVDAELAAEFGEMGLSEAAAKTAVTGR